MCSGRTGTHGSDPAQLTTLLNTTLTALAQIGVFHLGGKGSKLTEDQLWAWCKQAVTPPASDVKAKPARKAPRAAAGGRAGRPKKLTG